MKFRIESLFNDDLFPEGMDSVRTYRGIDLVLAGLLTIGLTLTPMLLLSQWTLDVQGSPIFVAVAAGCALPFAVLAVSRLLSGLPSSVDSPLPGLLDLMRGTALASVALLVLAAIFRLGGLLLAGEDFDYVSPSLAVALIAQPAAAFGYRALQARVADRVALQERE
jgi:hypothetical protein